MNSADQHRKDGLDWEKRMGIENDLVETKVKDPQLIKLKQRQICEGALKVFRRKGFHAASIREIAQAAGLSIGSLYDYIEKKEDILFLVHREVLDQIYDRLDKSSTRCEDPREQLVFVFRELIELSSELREEMLFVYTETKSLDEKYLPEILQREAEFVDKVEDLIRRGVTSGVFTSPKPKISASIIVLLGALLPLRGWNIPASIKDEEIFGELVNFVLRGLQAEPLLEDR